MPTNLTPRQSSEYVSLRDYIDTRFNSLDKATEVAFCALDKQLVNISSQAYITKKDFDIQMDKLDEDIRMLRESRALLEGKANQDDVNKVRGTADLARLMAIIGLLIAAISLVLRFLGL
jgi:hypothetical protein